MKGGQRLLPLESPPLPQRVRTTTTAVPAAEESGPPATSWATAVGRKKGKGGADKASKTSVPPPTPAGGGKGGGGRVPSTTRKSGGRAERGEVSVANARKRRPTTAAVQVTAPPGELSGVMRRARAEIQPRDLGITQIRLGRALNGGILLQIPGEAAGAKADVLAAKMKALLAEDSGVRITRPSKRIDLRVTGLDGSASSEEIRSALATAGRCPPDDIRVGTVRSSRRGVCSVWAQAPIEAGLALAEASEGVAIGWATARVALLKSRPLRCFRCLANGHIQLWCPSGHDRSRCCQRCGKEGHVRAMCRDKAHCPACEERGKKASHEVGGPNCPNWPPLRRDGRRGGPPPGAPQPREEGMETQEGDREAREKPREEVDPGMDVEPDPGTGATSMAPVAVSAEAGGGEESSQTPSTSQTLLEGMKRGIVLIPGAWREPFVHLEEMPAPLPQREARKGAKSGSARSGRPGPLSSKAKARVTRAKRK